jgi:hypothetical protein
METPKKGMEGLGVVTLQNLYNISSIYLKIFMLIPSADS